MGSFDNKINNKKFKKRDVIDASLQYRYGGNNCCYRGDNIDIIFSR